MKTFFLAAMTALLAWNCSGGDDGTTNAANPTSSSSGTSSPSAPAGPTNLSVVEANAELTLNWEAVENAEKYEVRYRKQADEGEDEAEFTTLPEEGADDITNPTVAIDDLTNGTLYELGVLWVSSNGAKSQWSSTTGRPFHLPKPSALAVIVDDAQLRVTWNPVATASGYHLRHKESTAGDDAFAVVTNGIETTSHTIMGLGNGTNYTIQVRAANEFEQTGAWSTNASGTPTDVLGAPTVVLTDDTGDDNTDGLTTDATVTISARGAATVTITLEVDDWAPSGTAPDPITMPVTGTTNVDLVDYFGLDAPTGNATNAFSVEAEVSASGLTTPTAQATTFKLVSAPTQAQVDAISLELADDTGTDGDNITTDALVSISGEVPDGAILSFAITTNGESHIQNVVNMWTGPTNVSTRNSSELQDLPELLEVVLTATMKRHSHTVRKAPFEYTLIPWPPEVTVRYRDRLFGWFDGSTQESELTIGGLELFDGTFVKLTSYVITNTADSNSTNVTVRRADPVGWLSADYKIDIRTVKPYLGQNERFHSFTFGNAAYHGHVLDATVRPTYVRMVNGEEVVTEVALEIVFGTYSRKFDVVDDAQGFAITDDDIVLVASTNTHKIHFYELDGDDATITIGGAAVSNFGSRGSDTNQFDEPRDIAIGLGNKIYVADGGNNRISVFNSDFSHVTNVSISPNPPVALTRIFDNMAVTVDGSIRTFALDDHEEGLSFTGAYSAVVLTRGTFHLAHETEDRVEAHVFSETVFVSENIHYNLRVGTDTGSSQPVDIVRGTTTRWLYVADKARHQVIALDYDGNQYNFVGLFGKADRSTGTNRGQFNGPTFMVVHGGHLYVLDSGNDRIQVFFVPEY